MKWSYLIEASENLDLINLGSQDVKMWVNKLLKDFLERINRKVSVNATTEDILSVMTYLHGDKLKRLSSETIERINSGVADGITALGIDPHSSVPPIYQRRAKTIIKDFVDARKADKNKVRTSDKLLLTLVFSKTFNIRPDKNTLKKSLSSNKALSSSLKLVVAGLDKLGYKFTDVTLGVTPEDLMAIRSRRRL